MRTRSFARSQTDTAVLFALACAAVAAFAGQFAFGTQPSFFLPVGICALPFAAAPRRVVAYRIAAIGALALFIAVTGLRQGSFFLPSLAALCVSVYGALAARPAKKRRRR